MDLIDRQAAIERATKDHDFFRGATIPTDKARRDELLNVMCWLRELPSAQPQITYCAECIHWKHSDVRKSYCEVFDWMSKAEDFCSFAERRTE